MTVIAVAGDDLVAGFNGELHAHDNGFLPDVEMAKAADQAHAVKLAGLFLEAADHQHIAVDAKFYVAVRIGRGVENTIARPGTRLGVLSGDGGRRLGLGEHH